MADNLAMSGADEPYRMFTSHAELRLSLGEDNAHACLFEYGHQLWLLSDEDYVKFFAKQAQIHALEEKLPTLPSLILTDAPDFIFNRFGF